MFQVSLFILKLAISFNLSATKSYKKVINKRIAYCQFESYKACLEKMGETRSKEEWDDLRNVWTSAIDYISSELRNHILNHKSIKPGTPWIEIWKEM